MVFRNWHRALSPTIETHIVQLQGRGQHRAAPTAHGFSAVVNELADAVVPLLDLPFAFFGHSMGTLLAFELAQLLRKRAYDEPVHLFVSGRGAPHLPWILPIPVDASDEEFKTQLRELNGTPSEIIDDPLVMRILLPVLRSDFTLCARYVFAPAMPLRCPITVFGGSQDPTTPLDDLNAWREHTSGPVVVRLLPGDHFFIHTAEARLLQEISLAIPKALRSTALSSHRGMG